MSYRAARRRVIAAVVQTAKSRAWKEIRRLGVSRPNVAALEAVMSGLYDRPDERLRIDEEARAIDPEAFQVLALHQTRVI